jgi:hydrogenase maturation protein HypF
MDLKLSGKVVGIALDGVGWGLDGTIWGAEVLLFDTDKYGFKRLATIKQIPITSDIDAKYPVRLIFGFLANRGYELHEIYRFLDVNVTNTPPKDVEVVYKLVKLGKYTPASSTGRLLDLVAAILNPSIERTYEGEPAIWLEGQAWRGEFRNLDCFRVLNNEGLKVLDFDEAVDWVISNKHRYGVETIARSFLYNYGYYLGELIVEAIRGLRVDHVVASGGAVVNEFIYRGLRDRLAQEQMIVHLPRNIPPNDGGLAFGQVVAASLHAEDKGLC